jgi:5'-phosphate synthase pdxT subunit
VVVAGVLALQGDFQEHAAIFESLGVKAIEVRNKQDLSKCELLAIPGGESTAISNLLSISGLGLEIKKRARQGMVVFGTCAGAILLAKKVIGEKRYKPLGLIDIEIKRNAFGRQIDSFEAELEVKGIGKVNGVFIRAPEILKFGKGVEVLATFRNKPVIVRQHNVVVATFHPEIAKENKIHLMLTELAKKNSKKVVGFFA